MDNRRFFRQAMMLTLAAGLLASCSKENAGEPDPDGALEPVEVVPIVTLANGDGSTTPIVHSPDGPVDGTQDLTLYFVKANVAEGQDEGFEYGNIISATRLKDEGNEDPENPHYKALEFSETIYYPVDGSYIRMWGFYPKPDSYEAGDRAEAYWELTGKEDLMIAKAKMGNNKNDENNPIKFEFEHALCQLQFYVHAESELAAASWGKVTEVAINSTNECTFYFDDGDNNIDDPMPDFVDSRAFDFGGDEPFTVTNAVQILQATQSSLEGNEEERNKCYFGTLMISQPRGTSLTLLVKTEKHPDAMEVKVTADAASTNAFKAGYATRVYLKFQPGEITATLKSGNWISKDVEEVVLGEYPYVQRGNIIVSKDLLGESGMPIHENWTSETMPAHVEDDGANSVSASFEVAEVDIDENGTTTFDWATAKEKCAGLEGGNWRLPTQAELFLIGECGDLLTGVTEASGEYWSATEVGTVGGTQAVAMELSDKPVENQAEKTMLYKVRCVRDI